MAWITDADVRRAAGIDPAATVDAEWLAEVTAAAEAWARDQRADNGYQDDPDPTAPAPNARVKHGTVLEALRQYRTRGTYGGPSSFDGMGAMLEAGPSYLMILGYLGIPRAVVDAPAYLWPEADAALALGRVRRGWQ